MVTTGSLKRALLEWMQWFKETNNQLKPRSNLPKFQQGLCLALTGVRRSGKTFTSVEIAQHLKLADSTFYFNFEDPLFFSENQVENIGLLIDLFEEERGHLPKLVILDEIQNIRGWERWVRKEVDLGRFQVIVTGSSSQLLSSEIATALSGRAIEHTIWPISFSEALAFKKAAASPKELSNYLQWGGFPKAVLTSNESERILLLKQYMSDIVFRDVVARHSIKNQHQLNQLVTWYVTNMSCLHSYTAIRKAFGMSIELASTLTAYLSQAYLAFEMARYHPNLKVQARDPKKVYMIDSGLRKVSLLSDREDLGALAENTVYLELRRRSKEVFYFKGKQEVDFVICELGKPTLAIQVCYSNLDDQNTREREVLALVECLESLGLKTGIILTLNYEHRETVHGMRIHFKPLHQWLSTQG